MCKQRLYTSLIWPSEDLWRLHFIFKDLNLSLVFPFEFSVNQLEIVLN